MRLKSVTVAHTAKPKSSKTGISHTFHLRTISEFPLSYVTVAKPVPHECPKMMRSKSKNVSSNCVLMEPW
jgi:hypothetical protein